MRDDLLVQIGLEAFLLVGVMAKEVRSGPCLFLFSFYFGPRCILRCQLFEIVHLGGYSESRLCDS